MDDCIFCKIAAHKIPKEFTYEDDAVMVFPDIHPVTPVHLLIVPKKHVKDFMDFDDEDLLNKFRAVVKDMIRKFGLDKKGFRLVNNGGGSQIINHFHLHLRGP